MANISRGQIDRSLLYFVTVFTNTAESSTSRSMYGGSFVIATWGEARLRRVHSSSEPDN